MTGSRESASGGLASGGSASGGPAVGGPAEAPFTLRYRPELDGLRALAAALVVAYHLDGLLYSHDWGITGGWIGVDVFFVLSGYLITTLLLNERATSGTIALRRFTVRRLGRLVPAVALLVVGVGLAALVFDSEALGDNYWTGAIGSLTYTINWLVVLGHGVGPFGHLWTLAIEEQFYLVWPLLVLAVTRLAPPDRRSSEAARPGRVGVAVGLAGLWLCALAWGAYNLATDASLVRLSFSSDLHGAPTMIAGALLAVAPDPRRLGRWGDVPAFVGVVVVTWLTLGYRWTDAMHNSTLYLPITLASVALVVGALSSRCGFAALLRLRPLVWLGKRSYGLYLWHLPVILLVREQLGSAVVPTLPVALVVTLAITEASYRLVELPVRQAVRAREGRASRGPAPPADPIAPLRSPT